MARVRAVVIDDHADLRFLVGMALRSEGVEAVGEAADGATGIELARLHQPDVVIVDVMMPGMDGLAALRGLRRAAPEARIVVYTSLHTSGIEPLARDADALVEKSGGVPALVAGIKSALSRKESHDQDVVQAVG